MKRDFLESLGLEKDIIDKILDENSRDIGREKGKTDAAKEEADSLKKQLEDRNADLETLKKSNGDAQEIQKQLDELRQKYEADGKTHSDRVAELEAQLAARDYDDAISSAISDKGLKFSSKSAQRAFVATLKEKNLSLKDGSLEGLDDFIKEQKAADPEAFAPEKAPAKFAGPVGRAAAPEKTVSRAAQIANAYYANRYGTANNTQVSKGE